jgi:hypothetical protein
MNRDVYMQIGNFKFYNQLDNMIQIPDSNATDYMCTHYRKPVVDPFHLELHNRIETSNSPESIGIMLNADHYPFKDTSSGIELRDIEGFKSHQGLKMEVSEYMTEIDLQLFSTIPREVLFYDEACKLLDHKLIPKDSSIRFENMYGQARDTQTACFVKIYDKNRTLNTTPLILPTNCFEYLTKAKILENNKETLARKNIFFIPFEPAVDPDILIDQDMLNKAPKPYDCFLSGTLVPFVYPYRFIAFQKVNALSNSIKVLKEGRAHFRYLADREILSYKEKDITKHELDNNTAIIAKQQYQDYLQRIYDSKVGIVCSSVFGYGLKKYFEYMARGCVLVGDMPKYADHYGFKHMENVFQCDVDDIENAVKYLISNDSIRLRLARNALQLVTERFTMKNRVDSFLEHLVSISNKFSNHSQTNI